MANQVRPPFRAENWVWNSGTLDWDPQTAAGGGGGATGTIGAAVPATASPAAVKDNAGNLAYPNLDASGNLLVAVTGAGSGGTSSVDGAAYTAGASAGTGIMGVRDDTAPTALAEDKIGLVRLSTRREVYVQVRDAAGNERGLNVTAGNAVLTDASATTQPVSGTVTTSPPANASTNVAQVAGTATDVNSGAKSAGTIRVVLATDQPSLTNKLLVTPDSVALPANQSTNVNQFGGSAVVTGTGVGGAGIPRVTVSSDSTVTANAGTNLNTSALALESGGNLATIAAAVVAQEVATAGLKGIEVFGAVTTAKPTYTTAKSDALSLDTSGLLRISLADTPANTNKFLVTPDSVALPANQSVNVNQLAGTTTDTNSGAKSAGTLRVVLATDQPQLTNKLLVTPDSVALPANQSVNVAQLAGTATSVNSGTKDAGTLRVTLATDQVQLTNALKVDPSGVISPVSIAATVTVDERRGLAPFFVSIDTNTSGANTLVAADATRKIKILSYAFVTDGAVTVQLKSGAVALSGAMSFVANTGMSSPAGTMSSWIAETAVNTALVLTLGGAVGVRGHLAYFLE